MTVACASQTVDFRSFVLRAAILAISMLVCPPLSFAQSRGRDGPCPELPGNGNAWREEEHWVWKEICEGRVANLQQRFGGSDEPAEAQKWPPQRDLGQQFIETVLTDNSYRSRIPRNGVLIIGARFRERLDLSHLKLDRDLWLTNSSFEGTQLGEALNLVGAEISGRLNLDASTASKRINMDSLHAGQLSMSGGPSPSTPDKWIRSVWQSIWLATASIDRDLSVNDSTVAGEFQMTNMEVGKNLEMINANLTQVILKYANIAGVLAIE